MSRLINRFPIGILLIFLFFGSCQSNKTIDPISVDSNKKIQEFLLRGWNTWNNSDLLNYVFLPEGLSMKIGFRGINDQTDCVNSFNTDSSAEKVKYRIIPLGHSTDGRYIDYILIWKDLEAKIQVVRERRDIIILYTPVKLPENPPVIYLEVGMLWNKNAKLERNGNFIQVGVGAKIFSIGATKNVENIPLPLSSSYLSFKSDKEIAFFSGEVKSIDKIRDYVKQRKNIFEDRQKLYGNLSEAFNVIQSALSWNMTYDPFNHLAITPVSRDKAEEAGGWILNSADSYLTAAMYSAFYNTSDNWIDKFNSYSNAIAITRSITNEGFIPHSYSPLPIIEKINHTRAPLGSLMCSLIYKKYNEKWFLKEVYDDLLKYNRWWDINRNNRGYLSWGSGLAEDPAGTKENAIAESDLASTNYFDDIVYNSNSHKLEIASVELLSLYIADCKALAEVAGILEKDEDKTELLMRAEKYSESLEELWDNETGIYRDKNLLTNQFCSILPATNFYSLLSGVPDQLKAERMVREHLFNPDEFFGEYMIPLLAGNNSVSIDTFSSGSRILPKANFLIYLGLRNYDFPDSRKLLSERSMNLVMKEWGMNKRIYENYNSLTGLGSDLPGNDSFYTTGGLLALIGLMEGGYW